MLTSTTQSTDPSDQEAKKSDEESFEIISETIIQNDADFIEFASNSFKNEASLKNAKAVSVEFLRFYKKIIGEKNEGACEAVQAAKNIGELVAALNATSQLLAGRLWSSPLKPHLEKLLESFPSQRECDTHARIEKTIPSLADKKSGMASVTIKGPHTENIAQQAHVQQLQAELEQNSRVIAASSKEKIASASDLAIALTQLSATSDLVGQQKETIHSLQSELHSVRKSYQEKCLECNIAQDSLRFETAAREDIAYQLYRSSSTKNASIADLQQTIQSQKHQISDMEKRIAFLDSINKEYERLASVHKKTMQGTASQANTHKDAQPQTCETLTTADSLLMQAGGQESHDLTARLHAATSAFKNAAPAEPLNKNEVFVCAAQHTNNTSGETKSDIGEQTIGATPAFDMKL